MSEIRDDLLRATIFHDFLELLHYLEAQPITKTKGGAISRKDIYALMDHLECIKKIKIQYDEYGWKIQNEYQVRDLDLLRNLGLVTYTVYNRKDKLLISKNGRGFLHLDDELVQCTQFTQHYFERLYWSSLHPSSNVIGKTEIIDVLQANQNILWRTFILQHTQWLDYLDFQKRIIDKFNFGILGLDDFQKRTALEYGFLRPLEKFGCFEIVYAKDQHGFDHIRSFRPTKLGLHIFCEELEHPLYSGHKPIINIWRK